MSLNELQKKFVCHVLAGQEEFLKIFFVDKIGNKNVIPQIFQAILEPSFVIEGAGIPLDFSIMNDILKLSKDPKKLLPHTNIKTPKVHQAAYSIWATANGDKQNIAGFYLIQYENEETVKKLKSESPQDYIEKYNASFTDSVKETAQNWLKTRIQDIQKENTAEQSVGSHTSRILQESAASSSLTPL